MIAFILLVIILIVYAIFKPNFDYVNIEDNPQYLLIIVWLNKYTFINKHLHISRYWKPLIKIQNKK